VQRIVVQAGQIQGDRLQLTTDQHHYLQRVLRLRLGDRFLVLNGEGALWLATLISDTQAQLAIAPEAIAASDGSLPPITLAAALPKQGFDEVVRQATELGVTEIVPIISDRTLLRPSPNRLQRWQRIAAEAGEQSERLRVPHVKEPVTWLDWLEKESQDLRYLCVARKDVPSLLAVYLATAMPAVEVAIGPEGGWTDAEIAAAIARGYHPVSLGRSILRSVTASITALSILRAGFDLVTIKQSTNV
jgi:16S rRNA (uracil1498-N3)-methyltransferase